MKIGVFGGSFNPIHNGHVKIIKYLLDNNYVDKIIVVPTGDCYEYKTDMISAKYRYTMLKLALGEDNRIIISEYELKNNVVHTYETLEYLKNIYNNSELYFICGMDNINYVNKWYKGEELLKNFKFIVFNRDNINIEDIIKKYEEYHPSIEVVSLSIGDISSTYIRKEIKSGNSVNCLIDKKVLKFIKDKKLY